MRKANGPQCREERVSQWHHLVPRARYQSWVLLQGNVEKRQPSAVGRAVALESHTQMIVLQERQDHEHPVFHRIHPGRVLECRALR